MSRPQERRGGVYLGGKSQAFRQERGIGPAIIHSHIVFGSACPQTEAVFVEIEDWLSALLLEKELSSHACSADRGQRGSRETSVYLQPHDSFHHI